jgi:hypothetical protein
MCPVMSSIPSLPSRAMSPAGVWEGASRTWASPSCVVAKRILLINYAGYTADGKTLRSNSIFLHDENGEPLLAL